MRALVRTGADDDKRDTLARCRWGPDRAEGGEGYPSGHAVRCLHRPPGRGTGINTLLRVDPATPARGYLAAIGCERCAEQSVVWETVGTLFLQPTLLPEAVTCSQP